MLGQIPGHRDIGLQCIVLWWISCISSCHIASTTGSSNMSVLLQDLVLYMSVL